MLWEKVHITTEKKQINSPRTSLTRNEKTTVLKSGLWSTFGIMIKCYVPWWKDLIFQDAFSLFYAIVHGIGFLILFLDCSMQMCRNTIDFV